MSTDTLFYYDSRGKEAACTKANDLWKEAVGPMYIAVFDVGLQESIYEQWVSMSPIPQSDNP